jgi:hypothetical protein
VCLGAARDRSQLEEGLRTLVEVLDGPAESGLTKTEQLFIKQANWPMDVFPTQSAGLALVKFKI